MVGGGKKGKDKDWCGRDATEKARGVTESSEKGQGETVRKRERER